MKRRGAAVTYFEHPSLHEMLDELRREELARRHRHAADTSLPGEPGYRIRFRLAHALRQAADRIEPSRAPVARQARSRQRPV